MPRSATSNASGGSPAVTRSAFVSVKRSISRLVGVTSTARSSAEVGRAAVPASGLLAAAAPIALNESAKTDARRNATNRRTNGHLDRDNFQFGSVTAKLSYGHGFSV